MAHRGDVFPYAALAGELGRRGHDVTYVVPREFHPGFPGLGRRANRRLWRIARSPRLGRLTSADAFVAFRRRLGLATPDGWNVIDARLSPHLNLGLASP